jgi:mRNA interferase MazF
MNSYSKNEIILVRYPFSDLSGSKVRPAVVINAPHSSNDLMIVPLTSRISSLLSGEFVLSNWKEAGLNTPTAAKRGIFTVQNNFVIKIVGKLESPDSKKLENSLRFWLGLK